MRLRVLIGMTALALSASLARADGKPSRIVSLNLCTDELVLRLADRKAISSVTWLSRDPSGGNVPELAARVPINHGLAEEIVPQNPDLVLAGTFTTRVAVALLKRLGVPLAEIGIAHNLDDVRRQIRQVAGLVGERERGEALVASLDARLASLPPSPPVGVARPRAIVLNPSGVTVGAGTLADEVITRAGLTNVAAELHLDSYGQLPLEMVAMHGIDILILSASRDGPPALATEILRHPVLQRLSDRTRLVVLPTRLWGCAGPEVADAIARLSEVARDVRRGVPSQ